MSVDAKKQTNFVAIGALRDKKWFDYCIQQNGKKYKVYSKKVLRVFNFTSVHWPVDRA